jgi:hypothetical protein
MPDETRESEDSGSGRDDTSKTDDTRWEGSREERQRARARRGSERVDDDTRRRARKERVLHTRISEQLSEDIRRLAEDLRVPTSNLVRNVLEEVFTVVESVSDDVGEILEDVLEEAEATRDRIRRRHHHSRKRRHRRSGAGRSSWADRAEAEIRRDEESESPPRRPADPPRERPVFPDVIGWQPLVLNQGQDCSDCGRTLPRGTRAFVGATENGLSRNTLCRDCLQDR